MRYLVDDGREEGATAVEYAIMVAAIAAAIIAIVFLVGVAVFGQFDGFYQTYIAQ